MSAIKAFRFLVLFTWVFALTPIPAFSAAPKLKKPILSSSLSTPELIKQQMDDGKTTEVNQSRIFMPLIQKPVVHPLVGRWLDPDTSGTVTTIDWVIGGYRVVSVINPNRGGNEVVWSSWSPSSFSWAYCVPNGPCIISESISDTTLVANWHWDDWGNSGTTYYTRLP